MSDHGQDGRRTERRSFRPSLDGTLEPRLLLSGASVAIKASSPNIQAQIARGGQVSLIRDTDGEIYNVNVIGGGSVRSQAMSGGRVRLIVERTGPASVLSINPVSAKIKKGTAHDYPTNVTGDHILHVGEIQVKTGKISQILAYRTAELSGPVTIAGTSQVSRIAFYSIVSGGAINTGGDLDTLSVYNDLTLGGGPGIEVGRDLNWLNVGGNINISDGSRLSTGRDIGLTQQLPKGTDPGGRGAVVQGNVNVNEGGRFVIGRALDATFLVNGTLTGFKRITGPTLTGFPVGAQFFVALGGISFN